MQIKQRREQMVTTQIRKCVAVALVVANAYSAYAQLLDFGGIIGEAIERENKPNCKMKCGTSLP